MTPQHCPTAQKKKQRGVAKQPQAAAAPAVAAGATTVHAALRTLDGCHRRSQNGRAVSHATPSAAGRLNEARSASSAVKSIKGSQCTALRKGRDAGTTLPCRALQRSPKAGPGPALPHQLSELVTTNREPLAEMRLRSAIPAAARAAAARARAGVLQASLFGQHLAPHAVGYACWSLPACSTSHAHVCTSCWLPSELCADSSPLRGCTSSPWVCPGYLSTDLLLPFTPGLLELPASHTEPGKAKGHMP